MPLISCLPEPISKRIDIARRISNAEIKYREIILKKFRSAAPSSDMKRDPTLEDDDDKVAKVMQEVIAPRLARLRTSYFGPHEPHLISDWLGVSWLFALWRGESGVSIHRHERRITNIELMLNLVDNRDSLGSNIWKRIALWQLLKYQREAREFLERFERRISKLKDEDRALHEAYRSALAKAVRRAQAKRPLNNATWADVFVIRHLYHDPTLKSAIDSHWTPSKDRQDLMAKIDQMMLEEPHFPPECHALDFNLLVPN
ncbi:hypothetical protein M407DRAFT_18836 [Tulasnella calospora MUT 4182]|uniref:Uncharacterized protein n=1 Tax=Tulasnella calospora MUT 4182 TaxID=1051891 RepID=A0A0C3LEB2_9AGAM|nr:hypothetical protein M407DRAFT_18836 [Tulasnella calospora MUT 4182]